MFTQGTPISVQSRLKRGSPVQSSPFGAAPGAENVSNTSKSPKISAKAAPTPPRYLARLVISGRENAPAFVEPAAQQGRHRVVIVTVLPGERHVRLEILYRRINAPCFRDDL